MDGQSPRGRRSPDCRVPRPLTRDDQAYFYDPRGEGAGRQSTLRRVCRGFDWRTQPRDGQDGAYAYCQRCHPGAIKPWWLAKNVLAAMLKWRKRYGQLPTPTTVRTGALLA